MKVIEIEETKKENNVQFFEIKDLPSRFKFYPKGTKILGRRLTVPEVKKLAEINSENFDFVIDSVLEQTIKGIELNEIRYFDKLYIILWLRANTYKEPGYIIDYECAKCKNKIEYEFDLDKLEIIYLPENFNGLMTFGNNIIEVVYQSIKSQKEVDEIKKLNENEKDDNKKIDISDLELAANLKINKKDFSLLEKYNFIRNVLNPEQYVKLKDFIKKNEFGFKEFINTTCSSCGGNIPMGITFCTEFFIPRYQFK